PNGFVFDYDPAASVSLQAGNQIVLAGNSLPRSPGGSLIPIVYPPTLRLGAGAGGIQLGTDLALFPSPIGDVEIQTDGGGSLRSTIAGQIRYLTLSDSDHRQWTGV